MGQRSNRLERVPTSQSLSNGLMAFDWCVETGEDPTALLNCKQVSCNKQVSCRLSRASDHDIYMKICWLINKRLWVEAVRVVRCAGRQTEREWLPRTFRILISRTYVPHPSHVLKNLAYKYEYDDWSVPLPATTALLRAIISLFSVILEYLIHSRGHGLFIILIFIGSADNNSYSNVRRWCGFGLVMGITQARTEQLFHK
jgi:hypothetical protein